MQELGVEDVSCSSSEGIRGIWGTPGVGSEVHGEGDTSIHEEFKLARESVGDVCKDSSKTVVVCTRVSFNTFGVHGWVIVGYVDASLS